jgi:hypothetical protein
MLTATTCCAALVVPLASAAAPPAPAVVAIQATRPSPGERPELTLVKFDPASLEERRHASLGRHYLPYGYAFSPDRQRVVIVGAAEGVLLHVDLRAMQLTGEATVPPMSPTWTGPETIIGLRWHQTADGETSTSAYRLDPFGQSVTEIWNAPERVLGRARRGNGELVLMTTPAYRALELGGPLRLLNLGPAGIRRAVTLDEIRIGLENWRVPASGQLPPIAARLVERARYDLAARTGVPAAEIVASRVTPRGTNAFFRTSYEITLAARGEYYRYLIFLEGGNPVLGQPARLPSAPPPNENDLLKALPGSWQVTLAQLVPTPSRRRAYVVTSGEILAAVDLGTGGVRFHKAPSIVTPAASLDEKRLVLPTPQGVGILRVGSVRVRLIQRGAGCSVRRAQGRFLVFGWRCPGLSVYGLDGVRRRRLFRGRRLNDADVTVAGHLCYVRTTEAPSLLRIADLSSGRMLGLASPRYDGLLMISG